MFPKESGTKAGAIISSKYQIQLKKSICSTKIQKQPPSAFCKRMPATLLTRGSSRAKFLKASILKNICERLLLKINASVTNLGFIKTTDHRPTDHRPTNPLSTDPPTAYHKLTLKQSPDSKHVMYSKVYENFRNLYVSWINKWYFNAILYID